MERMKCPKVDARVFHVTPANLQDSELCLRCSKAVQKLLRQPNFGPNASNSGHILAVSG